MSPKTAVGDTMYDKDILGLDDLELPPHPIQKPPPREVVWRNVCVFSLLHGAAGWGLLLLPGARGLTLVWAGLTYLLAALGVTAGAHRLWAHRAYRARLPLRVFLAFCNCVSFQNSIFEWARDHRVHHKFSETDADPHNASRGFFFAHIGWLLVKKHPDVKRRGGSVDVSDLWGDPVVAWQHRHFLALGLACTALLPALLPAALWGEAPLVALLVAGALRYTIVLHATWLVNSAAHMWGNKPYDASINPSENPCVAFLAAGEGFHNYHHTFPHDYATSEWGWRLNFTTAFIDACAWFGQAYDRKSITRETVLRRKARTGQGAEPAAGS